MSVSTSIKVDHPKKSDAPTFGAQTCLHFCCCPYTLGQIEKISVFQMKGLEILGRLGKHIFLIIFFSGKNKILCILNIFSQKI